ncbi:malonate decarboxylase holo-ACP synthase [Celerinatantimonas sp. MCCC 1A17872]|uniref:malonate decarboxylase holo-ACP synthase n=1 Tax=Celerinatantimonas sp. MCCC 1A17872 TaxID=3177514 RepID=UPI0038BFCFDE
MQLTPHDLVWIDTLDALHLSDAMPEWVKQTYRHNLPVVVRRDQKREGLIAAGIRGKLRSERQACWVETDHIIKVVQPHDIIDAQYWQHYDWNHLPVVKSLIQLAEINWPQSWGVTGSCGYSLATGHMAMRAQSDLDLQVISFNRPEPDDFKLILKAIENLPVRVDIQLETPSGGVALNDWLKHPEHVLVKSNTGPYLSSDPWSQTQPEA